MGSDIQGARAGERLGTSVSISADGSRLVAGNKFGHVRILEWDKHSWQDMEVEDRDSSYTHERTILGNRVAISPDGNRVVTGFLDVASSQQHLRVFEWAYDRWIQLGTDIVTEEVASGLYFGDSVALSHDGHRVATCTSRLGRVLIYEWTGEGWESLGSDVPSAYNDNGDDDLEINVGMSGDGNRIIVASPSGESAGVIQVFEWNGNTWIQLGNDIYGNSAGDRLGWSVAMSRDGHRIVAGVWWGAYVRVLEWNGNDWTQVGSDIHGEREYDTFGASVAISSNGNRLVVGTPDNHSDGSVTGHFGIFDWNGETWIQVGQNVHGRNAADLFGDSVAISSDGTRVIAGSAWNSDNEEGSGHVLAFDISSSSSVSTSKL